MKPCTLCPRLVKSRRKIVTAEWAQYAERPPRRMILFIGEAPGYDEDSQGRPFVGMTGVEVRHLLWLNGLAPYTLITNMVKCRPPDNADPTPDELANCEPNLWELIAEHDPDLIISAGRFSSRWALGRDDFTMEMITGIPYHSPKLDRAVLPLVHPAAGWHRQRDMSFVMNAFKIAGKMWKEGWR